MKLDNKFTEADKSQVIEFLNFIAVRATFQNWTTDDSIKHFKLLAHMQQVILPKIESNILEILEIRKVEPAAKPAKEEKASKK